MVSVPLEDTWMADPLVTVHTWPSVTFARRAAKVSPIPPLTLFVPTSEQPNHSPVLASNARVTSSFIGSFEWGGSGDETRTTSVP